MNQNFFVYSVVGFLVNAAGQIEVKNIFGAAKADCKEYARRGAIMAFKKLHPNCQIISAAAAETTEGDPIHVTV